MRIFGIFAWHGVEWLRHWATNITDQIRNMLPHSAKRQHTAHAADIRKKMQRRINTDKVTMMFIKFKMRLSEAFDMLRYTNMQHPGLPDVAKVHLRLVVQGQILWATFAHICLSSSDTKIYKMLTWKMQKTFKILKMLEKRLDSNNEEALLGAWNAQVIRVQAAKLVTCSMRQDHKHSNLYVIPYAVCIYIYRLYIYIGYIGVYVCCMNQVNRCSWINRENQPLFSLQLSFFTVSLADGQSTPQWLWMLVHSCTANNRVASDGLKSICIICSMTQSGWLSMNRYEVTNSMLVAWTSHLPGKEVSKSEFYTWFVPRKSVSEVSGTPNASVLLCSPPW